MASLKRDLANRADVILQRATRGVGLHRSYYDVREVAQARLERLNLNANRKLGLLFVHVPKCGGSSMRHRWASRMYRPRSTSAPPTLLSSRAPGSSRSRAIPSTRWMAFHYLKSGASPKAGRAWAAEELADVPDSQLSWAGSLSRFPRAGDDLAALPAAVVFPVRSVGSVLVDEVGRSRVQRLHDRFNAAGHGLTLKPRVRERKSNSATGRHITMQSRSRRRSIRPRFRVFGYPTTSPRRRVLSRTAARRAGSVRPPGGRCWRLVVVLAAGGPQGAAAEDPTASCMRCRPASPTRRRLHRGRPRPRLRRHQGRQPREAEAWLIVPDHEVTGIESPAVFDPPVARLLALRLGVAGGCCPAHPPADRGLAINSVAGRTQDLLHIHISCVLPAVRGSARRRADRSRLGGRTLPQPRRARLQRPQGRLARPQPVPAAGRVAGRPRRHGRAVAGGDRQRRRRLLPRHRFHRARRGRRGGGTARRGLPLAAAAARLDSFSQLRHDIGRTRSSAEDHGHGRHRIATRPDRSLLARRRRRPLGQARGPRGARHRRAGDLRPRSRCRSGRRRCRSPSAPSRS